MGKYRRIEVNAFRGRVTILSGESARETFDLLPSQNESISPNDSEECDAVEPDSPQGQLILLEAVRSLEQRLSPETRATIYTELAPPAASVTDESLQLSPHETKKEK